LGGLFEASDPALALAYSEKAIETGAEIEFQQTWVSYAGIAAAFRRLQNLDRAIQYYDKAIERLESLRYTTISAHRDTFAERHTPVYKALIEALVERNQGEDAVRAFNLFERARAHSLLTALAEARLDLEYELEADLRDRRALLNLRMAGLQKRLFEARLPEEESGHLSSQLSDAEREYDRLIVEIKRRNPRYSKLRFPENLTLEEARALLDGQTALLAYSVTKRSVTAFVLTQSTYRSARLSVPPDELGARARMYADLLGRDDGDGWRDISLRLYGDLLGPLRSEIGPGIERLVIIPDDVLHYLPFETLVQDTGDQHHSTGSPERRCLIEDFSISYVPSATVLSQLRSQEHQFSPADRADSLVLANPDLNGQRDPSMERGSQTRALFDDEGLRIGPIPFAAAEAEVFRRYAGEASEIYVGNEANETRIKAGRLDRFRILHFATHGLISQRAPARSSLVLSPSEGEDGFLQAREIYHLKLASDLVVLSACQTARGRVLSGEGVQGMARAFFHAGAKSVVASLWNVNDERTAAFMESFYRHLSEGQSKSQALRSAKLEMLHDERTIAPRYWAAFILLGEDRRTVPIAERARPNWALAAVAVFSAAIAAFLFLKRTRGKRTRRSIAG
jgi:CHAT domain-containing protein